MKTLLLIIIASVFTYKSFQLPENPRIGQVYARKIELSYGYGFRYDTIVILNVDELAVTFTYTHKYDEWMCPLSSLKECGKVIK